MKKVLLITLLCALVHIGYAQYVEKPKDVAASDAASRVNSNENSAIDNSLSKTEGAIKGLFKKKKKPADTSNTAKRNNTPNNNLANNNNNSLVGIGGATISAYNNYDFVPGDKIIFSDDFADDQNGEFPAHWNLGAGQAVVNQIAGKAAFLLTDGNYTHVSPLIKSPSYLTDPFTIEFDSYGDGGYLPNLFFYNTNADATAAHNDLLKVSINAGGAEVSNKEGLDLSANYPASISGVSYENKWHHIAIAYKNNQLKLYVDQYRVLVVPNTGVTPHAFDVEGIGDGTKPIVLANFRVANGGGMNMLGKKFTGAKIITHGINFDIDKAIIKPESMGTLNMVAGVLRDNPDIKFEIDGHTDNTGSPAHNAALSQQRADAVKTQLVTMGVDPSRLIAKGFGDTKPISENMTPEGKANNRRVEFVKQ